MPHHGVSAARGGASLLAQLVQRVMRGEHERVEVLPLLIFAVHAGKAGVRQVHAERLAAAGGNGPTQSDATHGYTHSSSGTLSPKPYTLSAEP